MVNHGKVGGNKQKQKKKKEEIEASLYLTHYSAQYSVLAHQSTIFSGEFHGLMEMTAQLVP